MAELKKAGQVKKILVTGCMTQRYKEDIFHELPEVDGLLGTGSYGDIATAIAEVMEKGEKPCHLGNIHTANQSGERILSTPPWYAYLRIAEGCDNHCAYCVIPSLRGKYRSRPMNELLDEAAELASAGVMAVIGTYGSAVTEASQNIIDEAEIMQIATGSTSVRLTEKGLPLFFRTCPRDDEQGRVASKVIAAKGFKKVAILHDNSSYAKGLAEEAQKGLKDAGVPVVFYDALTPSERDYTAILTKLKAADPDLIFFTGYYPEAGMLLRQKKEMHWDVPMMGGDAANNTDLVKIAGKDAAKGYFFISPPSAHDFDTPEAKDFFSRYKAQYNSLPSSVWSVLAGDAFKVIVAALQAGTDANPEAVAKYLKKDLKEYPGLTGKLGFNEKGDRIGDLYKVYEVDGNGGFVLQK